MSLSHHDRPITTAALPHWSDILITVHSLLSFTVQIGQPIEMSNTFSCLFLLFMLTLHEVMIPLFFFLISFLHKRIPSSFCFFPFPFYPTSPFLFWFCWFVFFLTTASWNRSGWHPRSLTGQCTSHLPPPLPSLSDSHPFFTSFLLFLFPTFLQNCAWLQRLLSATLHRFSTPAHTRFHPLLQTSFVILSSSPSTHSFFFLFQTTASSNLMWLQATPLWFDWFPALSYTFKALL